MNEEKSRLVPFKRPSHFGRPPSEGPGSIDFLGFTIYWGKSRRGYNIPKVKTSKSRFRRTLEGIKEWGKKHRHKPIREQWTKLNEKLRGHDAYYGVTHNTLQLRQMRQRVHHHWRKWLSRRNRGKPMSWKAMNDLLAQFPLAPPRVHHSLL